MDIFAVGAFIFFIIFVSAIISNHASGDSTVVDASLKETRNKVLAVTTEIISGKEIKNVLGAVTGVSTISASTDRQAEVAEKEALLSIMKKTEEMGGNAIIGLRMSSSSFEQQGSKWMMAKVFYSGTAVVI